MSLVSKLTSVVSAIGADIKALYERVQAAESNALPTVEVSSPTIPDKVIVWQDGGWKVANWWQLMLWVDNTPHFVAVQDDRITVDGEFVTVSK